MQAKVSRADWVRDPLNFTCAAARSVSDTRWEDFEHAIEGTGVTPAEFMSVCRRMFWERNRQRSLRSIVHEVLAERRATHEQ